MRHWPQIDNFKLDSIRNEKNKPILMRHWPQIDNFKLNSIRNENNKPILMRHWPQIDNFKLDLIRSFEQRKTKHQNQKIKKPHYRRFPLMSWHNKGDHLQWDFFDRWILIGVFGFQSFFVYVISLKERNQTRPICVRVSAKLRLAHLRK